MDFTFEVDPDLDLAIGAEISMDEAQGEYELDNLITWDGDPTLATEAKPGSEEKVRMLAARYAAGLPLWNDGDCYDHGPTDLLDMDGQDELDELEPEPDEI